MILLCCTGCGEAESCLMEGVSRGHPLQESYYIAGHKAYCRGAMDGTFPPVGFHIEGEMGGLWAGQFKIADGFTLSLSTNGSEMLPIGKAAKFTSFPYGCKFEYPGGAVDVTRLQFVPTDYCGLAIEYDFTNKSGQKLDIAYRLDVDYDFRPAWYSEAAADLPTGWSASCSQQEGRLTLKPGQKKKVYFFIAGATDKPEGDFDALLKQKKSIYADVLSRAGINIPDKAVQEAYDWAKINVETLATDFPGIHFMSAGSESPWLFGCDNTYAQQAVAATGDFELAQSTLAALAEVSMKKNGNGRIIHEMAPCGAVFHDGYVHETAQFINAVWEVFRWSGDEQWLAQMYPYMEKGLDWLFGECDEDGDLLPKGSGVREVKGLKAENIDVAAYSCKALESFAGAAEFFGDSSKAESIRAKAAILREKINTEFWNADESIFYDFIGTKEDALKAATGAAKHYSSNADYYEALAAQFEALPEDTHRGFITSGHWIACTPMDAHVADTALALQALDKIRSSRCGKWGPYLSSVDRDKSMTISNGVQAFAEANYGRVDQALEYLGMTASTLHRAVPGMMYEMLPNGGMTSVGWTLYGFAKVLIEGVFGIQPDAAAKTVKISPDLPSGWDRASIKNVRVGDMHFDLEVKRTESGFESIVHPDSKGWTLEIE